jgi:hypothetical protein
MKLIEHKKTCTKCKKEYPISNFYFKVKAKNTRASCCKKCSDEGNKLSYKRNLEKRKKRQIKYRQTEKGHFGELYSSMKKRWTRSKEKPEKYRVSISYKEFFQIWKKQKKKFGKKCPVTNVKMTMKKGLGNNKQCPTNISPDRIDPTKGYTKENIRFVTANFNTRKGAITEEEMGRCLELSFKKTRQA